MASITVTIKQHSNTNKIDITVNAVGIKEDKISITTDGKTVLKMKNMEGQDTETTYKWIENGKVLFAKSVTIQDSKRNFTRKRYLQSGNDKVMIEEYKSPKGVINKRYYRKQVS